MPSVLVANLVIGSLMVAGLWGTVEARLLLSWGAVLGLVTGLRGLLLWQYRRRAPEDDQIWWWGRCFAVGSVAAAAIWGSSAVLFIVPGDALTLTLVTFVIGGMSAGAVASHASHFGTFCIYLLGSTLPLAGRLVASGDRAGLTMGAMVVAYIGLMTLIARRFNATVISNMKLTMEKQRLLDNLESRVQERTEQLDEARAKAECANRAKSHFIAAASHDLRQPMQALRLFHEVLGREVREARPRQILAMAAEAMDGAEQLLTGLLDISRLEAGAITPEICCFPLTEVLDPLATECQPQAEAKGLVLRYRRSPLAQSTPVRSDRVLLARILRNLLLNALRYTRTGGVLVGCRRRGEDLRIEVWDSGIGIAPDKLGSIFDEFYQLDNLDGAVKGLGLGLAIVDRMARLLGHPIEVRSWPGHGSVFAVTVPIAGQSPAVGGPERSEQARTL